VLKRIFGHKREERTGGWRKFNNEKLHSFYSSLNNIRVIKSRTIIWAGHIASMGEMRNAHKILVGKPEQRRPLERPRFGW